jgi:hypothetical protein
MRKRGVVGVLCGVVLGVSVLAGPATAESESSHCQKLAAAWKKQHPKATLAQKQAEADKLAASASCNFVKNLKAL